MPDALEMLMEGVPEAFSREEDVRKTEAEHFMQDELDMPDMDDRIRDAMEALYGPLFPLSKDAPTEEDWAAWPKDRWQAHAGGVQHRLHLIERNRLFRKGLHWISATGTSGWREPPKPRDAARVVFNMVAAALDQRQQIVSEQRPGFKTRPATQDPDDMRKAEAQQLGCEYQWDQQTMTDVIAEAEHWAQTDGVSFLEQYWDPDAGPWHEAFGVDPMGNEVPMGMDGEQAQKPHKFPLGDPKTRVRRIEEVRVSAEASSTRTPTYWVIKDLIPKAFAVKKYGLDVAKESNSGDTGDEMPYSAPKMRLGYIIPELDELHSDQEKLERYTMYCDRSEYLPKGLTLVVVGNKVVFQGPLVVGVIPMTRLTDGSSDPAFYPTPIMDGWIDSQMRFNAVLSKWVENVRVNANPRLLAKKQAISYETLQSGTMTIIEAKGLGSLNDLVKPLEAFSLSADAKELLQIEKKNFEDLTGWNDTSRGQFSSEQSGRAILAIREQVERMFAPPVIAAAKAMSEWAKITLAFMRWGYDIPRMIGVEGKGRPDLVRQLVSDDLDGAIDVFVDPETLMPLPRALRLQLLDDLFAKGMIPPQEYRRRLPFAWIRNIEHPDEAHTARARRCAEALRNGQWLPVLFMDNEMIHKDILEREILLQDDTPDNIRGMAYERWMQLSQQEMMKMSGMGLPMPASAPPSAPQGAGGQGGAPLPPGQRPFAGTSPGVAAGTLSSLGGTSDQQDASRRFDSRMQQQGTS